MSAPFNVGGAEHKRVGGAEHEHVGGAEQIAGANPEAANDFSAPSRIHPGHTLVRRGEDQFGAASASRRVASEPTN